MDNLSGSTIVAARIVRAVEAKQLSNIGQPEGRLRVSQVPEDSPYEAIYICSHIRI
jgi:hypothetical protein